MRLVWDSLWAAAAGALIPVMVVLNGRLTRALGAPVFAAMCLFAVGLLCTTVAALVLHGRLPALEAFRTTSPMDFAGGAIVAFYIVSATTLAPRFGVANTILFVMVAQVFTSTAIDHVGWLGAPARPMSFVRGAGLLLLLVGLSIAQSRPG